MHLNINYLPQTRGAVAGEFVSELFGLIDDGMAADALDDLQVHLDWVQYKSNFREPLIIRGGVDHEGSTLPLAELAVDLRQFQAVGTRDMLRNALPHPTNGGGQSDQ